MIRFFGAFLVALPLVAALPAASAQAQSNLDADYRMDAPGYQQRVQPGGPNHNFPFGQRQSEQAPPPYFAPQPGYGQSSEEPLRPPAQVGIAPSIAPAPVPPSATAALPPEDQPELNPPQELPRNLQKQLVEFRTKEPAGTIIVDTPNTYLYYVLGHGQAIRYGIGVGREGFTWSGTERISRMKEWPDWFPPAEMIERQPYLPRMMAGGPGNPLGARALYLGNTLYRIHGTNQPSTIGKFVSSGCIRLLNEDIEDLYRRVQVGTRVVVLPGSSPSSSEVAKTGTHDSVMVEPAPTGTAISGGPLPPLR